MEVNPKERQAIELAAEDIMGRWEEWDAEGKKEARREQDGDAWHETVGKYLIPVLEKMLREARG